MVHAEIASYRSTRAGIASSSVGKGRGQLDAVPTPEVLTVDDDLQVRGIRARATPAEMICVLAWAWERSSGNRKRDVVGE